ncbi:MAG TPA: DNA polymerase III subunit delta [Pirellulales bacterium]|jgi:DNA polymerase-3 subunit delta|nr:DNA polymerase III subunit delta [Pirellulales bacterium]
MTRVLTAIDFLEAAAPATVPAVCVAFGDEPFFRRLVIARLQELVLGGDEFARSVLDADAEPRDVFDELSTGSLFGGGPRLVIVEDADDFVSKHRTALEDYLRRPKHHGVLVLDVRSWPSNTKLYKAVAADGLATDCSAPQQAALTKWLVGRARAAHGAKLERPAAETLVDIVGPEVGLLDQELAKLAAMAGPQAPITAESVQRHVGSWRTQTTWEMLDAALAGDAATALAQLDRLLLSGEEPIALLGQIGSTLRRFAAAARMIEQAEADRRRPNLRAALEAAGFKPFIVAKAEGQLKQLGRQRAGRLYRWLLEADLALKGHSSQRWRARVELERLVARLSKAGDPRRHVDAPVPSP